MKQKDDSKVIIISNRLPVKIERRAGDLIISNSEGGLATGLGSIYNEGNNIWVGWPGIVPKDKEEELLIIEKLKERNLVPVFLTEEEILGYYEGFSNEVLWPICHYSPSYAVHDPTYWDYYKKVNEKFSQSVFAYLEKEDTVWVHDYQLMLLPSLLRQQNNQLAIGYFHHIPFPPDEVFRCIPWRNELLTGLLGADLVAFHTFNDSLHFVNSCTHILNIPVKDNQLQINGRSVYSEVYPMGIDVDKFLKLSRQTSVKRRAKEIKEYFSENQLILSIDRLDYSKGIVQRINAFESLLNYYPELREKVVLYMLVVPSRDTVKQYRKLRDEIDRKVGNINAVFGTNDWTPIAYFYNSFPVEELSALYFAADVCLVSSVRDGMNLVSKEYIASKEKASGVLILSELAGASKELVDSILVNPNSVDQTREAMYQALHMPEEEKKERMQANLALVKKFNIHHWVQLFFARLKEIKQQQKKEFARKLGQETKKSIAEMYFHAQKRVFFLDYDGTLVGFHNDASKATPTNDLYNLLDTLQSDPKNQVVIISGRPHLTLEEWFGHKDFVLVGEHGVWKRYLGEDWKSKSNLSTRWKAPVKRIMNKFANRTAGSSVEEKEYSLAWHYRKVQPGLGLQKAHDLVDSLRYLIPYHGLQLLYGDHVIEVKNSEINKGKAACSIVNKLKPDFIFAIGDDVTDEDMFLELPSEAVTVKVGSKQSAAKYYAENREDAIALLEGIAGLTSEKHLL